MSGLVLITGVNGFLGSNLAVELRKRDFQVRGMIRKTSDLTFIKDENIPLMCGDLTNMDCLKDMVKGVDYIVNTGGKTSDWGDYNSFYRTNVMGVENLLTASIKENIKRFVQISSVAIHGLGNHIDTNEEGPFFPLKVNYCITKKMGEAKAFEFYKKHSLPVTAIRPGNIFGENDRITFLNWGKALEKGKLPYVSGGKYLTCPTYIKNLVDAIIISMDKEEAVGNSFLITDGLRITWKEYTSKVRSAMGVKENTSSIPGPVARLAGSTMEAVYKLFRAKNRPALTRYLTKQLSNNYHFNIDKAKLLLQWEPEVNIDTAIENAVRWYYDFTRKM